MVGLAVSLVLGKKGESKWYLRYFNNTLKLNVYISMYFLTYVKEYAFLVNSNVLTRENKY